MTASCVMGGRFGSIASAAYCIIGCFSQVLEENTGGLPAKIEDLL
jgi:hypothetical protein